MSLPEWLEPIRAGASSITAKDISNFVPPEGTRTRKGAVLILFGEGPAGPDLLLTERAHDMRSHPGQVSFPGGSIDEPTRRPPRQPCARPRRRPVSTQPVSRSSALSPSSGSRRATSR